MYNMLMDVICHGDFTVLDKLTDSELDVVRKMIRKDSYDVFRWAAEQGHLLMMERLIAFMPAEEVMHMIRADDYDAFRAAASNSHFAAMEQLIALTPPAEVAHMIRSKNYQAFRWMASNSHLAMMERLMAFMPAAEVVHMIRTKDDDVFRRADTKGHLAVMERLMLFPEVFAYADEQFADRASVFVEQFLERLSHRINLFTTANPAGVFDITDMTEARLCFYIMRHLIRQNTAESFEKLELLLTMSGLQHLVHQAVTPHRHNELLLVARQVRNRAAIAYLLTIPAVKALDQMVHRESSMPALTEDEHKRLDNAEKKYQAEMEALGGVPAIIDLIKTELIKRYALAPATVAQASIELPLAFNQFLEQPLSTTVRAQAFVSYYQHSLHSAYRYLSKPNPWMHPDAEYVLYGPEGPYSTYEDHQALIALMYLAVTDKDIPEIDGFSTEVRLDYFFKELAWIGRAHNWDNPKINPDTKELGDDLAADKPSCTGGVKRRLFQASFLLHHPLFEMLNASDIDVEVNKIVSAHFMRLITDENVIELSVEWDNIIAGIPSASPSPLDALNFSAAEEEQHMITITKMFEHRLDGTLKYYLQQRLAVDWPFHHLAEKFGGVVDLMGMLEQKQAELTQARAFAQCWYVCC